MTLKTLQIIIAAAAIAITVLAFATDPQPSRGGPRRSPEPSLSTPPPAVWRSSANEMPLGRGAATSEVDKAKASEKWSAMRTAKREEPAAEGSP